MAPFNQVSKALVAHKIQEIQKSHPLEQKCLNLPPTSADIGWKYEGGWELMGALILLLWWMFVQDSVWDRSISTSSRAIHKATFDSYKVASSFIYKSCSIWEHERFYWLLYFLQVLAMKLFLIESVFKGLPNTARTTMQFRIISIVSH